MNEWTGRSWKYRAGTIALAPIVLIVPVLACVAVYVGAMGAFALIVWLISSILTGMGA